MPVRPLSSRHLRPPPAERGLYVDDVTGPHGETAIALVDRRGVVIVRVHAARAADVPVIERHLARLLTELDRAPPLRLL